MSNTSPKHDSGSDFVNTRSVAEIIQQAIIAGRLPHGSVIYEDAICKQFNVSAQIATDVFDTLIARRFLHDSDLLEAANVNFESIEAAQLGEERQAQIAEIVKHLQSTTEYDVQKCRSLFADFVSARNLSLKATINEDILSLLIFKREFEEGSNEIEDLLRYYGKFLQIIWSDPQEFDYYCKDMTELFDLCVQKDAKKLKKLIKKHILHVDGKICSILKERENRLFLGSLPSSPMAK